ncbi:MAG TPA: chromate transporter [Symbiobacteriaceae bacterium]|nr:chromate transporter [Symbiobacteriaceae bacterium]
MWELFVLVVSLASVSFGGGQMLLAGLERALVQTGRLGGPEFAAAVALGQSTPGPLAAFTTAVGMAVGGLGGAAAATAGLLTVSLVVVLLIQRVPSHWYRLPRVKAGLAQLPPLIGALALFLAVRMLVESGSPGLMGIIVTAAVFLGRSRKVPTAVLLSGAVVTGMLTR